MKKHAVILLALLLSFSLQGNGTTNEYKAPFLHFSFDEIKDDFASNSGSGGQEYNAFVTGGTISPATGVIGKSVKLSNNGYFKLPEGVIANITDFTLSAWVYIHEQKDNQTVCVFANGTDQYLILMTQRGNAENGVSLVMTNNTGHANHTGKEERISYTKQKEKLSVNAWHHLAFTLKGNVGTLYVDGIKAEVKSDFTTNPSVLGHTTDNYIGRSTWNDPFLNGMIDDFRLYDYALTEKQIDEISVVASPIQAQEDKKNLTLDDLSAITSDLTLPTTGSCGSAITWQSSQPNHLNSKGIVFRPDAGAGDANIILTATIQKGSTTLTKDFKATVKDLNTELADLHVFSMQTGNPTVPAYLADASFYYDKVTDTFYAYGTNDGAGGGNVYPAQMWYSKDCKTWKNKEIAFPKSWTDYAGTVAVWAPTIEYNPATKKYYLMYSIESNVFIGMADHPLGPWEDANGTAPGKMFYKGYDGQFFVDEDNTMYIVTDAWNFKLMKMKFDGAGRMYFDNDDPRFTLSDSNDFVGRYNYIQINEIKNAFEASLIYKRNNLYYLMWSFHGSENYHVRYAVSESITGPYREINNSMTEPILIRDDKKYILGPGHHSMFDYNGRTFIAYHRQHYPFVDSKRQTCIEEVFFNPDGSIQKITPTHKGVTVVPNAPKDTRKNIALRKQTKVSSARDYDDSAWERRYRTHDISFRYSGHFAVDESFGTRWDAGMGAMNPYLIVDLGSDCRVDEIETFFEFTSRTYKYKLEYLFQKEAKDINTASEKDTWKVFADRSTNGAEQSPVTDHALNGKPVKARYIRLTILDCVNIPPTADGADMVNAENALSIFEIKVFGEDKSNDVNRTFEAVLFNNLSGLSIERNNSMGMNITDSHNNDYLLYENINLGKGVKTFTAQVASEAQGGRLEVYSETLSGKPIAVLNIPNTGGKQAWQTQSVQLNERVKGIHKKLYLVFKGDTEAESLFNLDWFRFE